MRCGGSASKLYGSGYPESQATYCESSHLVVQPFHACNEHLQAMKSLPLGATCKMLLEDDSNAELSGSAIGFPRQC